MLRVTDLAQLVMRQSLRAGDWAVDATVGNGHDTAFLAGTVGLQGRVFGFDVQGVALAAAAARVGNATDMLWYQASHDRLADVLPPPARGRIAGVMFNLGYLPGADRAVQTRAETTVAALAQALGVMAPGGRMTVIAYRGHREGIAEFGAVEAFAAMCAPEIAVTRMERVGAATLAPVLFVFERLGGGQT